MPEHNLLRAVYSLVQPCTALYIGDGVMALFLPRWVRGDGWFLPCLVLETADCSARLAGLVVPGFFSPGFLGFVLFSVSPVVCLRAVAHLASCLFCVSCLAYLSCRRFVFWSTSTAVLPR